MTPRAGPSDAQPSRRFSVASEAAGERLDRYLTASAGDLSRSRVQELVRAGSVRVDGVPVLRPGRRLAAGEVIDLASSAPPPGVDPLAGLELAVVYEDEHLAVVDKPAGLLSHPGPRTRGPSVSELAERRYGPLPSLQGADRPGIVHRLDAGTSGLVVLARELAAFEHLLGQFRDREVEKTYDAIVHGTPRFDTGWIEAPIGRSSARPERMSVVAPGEGRDAATYYEVLERYRGFARLACRPRTGRTHQIRVHLARLGHPLVGDPLYRRSGPHAVELGAGAPRLARQALHAGRLAFVHPASGRRLCFESPLPADLAALLAWLREQHAAG